MDWKSTSEWLFCLGGRPISWSVKKQTVVALNCFQAEYIALNEADKEAICLQRILKEIRFSDYSPVLILIYENNQGTIAFPENPEFHCRTKHIDIRRYHWKGDAIGQKPISLEYISTREKAVDGLTKNLTVKAFQNFKKMVGKAKRAVE